MRRRRVLQLVSALALARGATVEAAAPQVEDGVLRVAFLANNAAQAVRDPISGEWSGVAIDLAREFARASGLRLDLQGLAGVQPVIDALRSGSADVGFLAADPSREGPIRFTRVYLRNPQSILAAAGSNLATLEALKSGSWRIGVTRGDSVALHLARNYPNVRLVELPGAEIPPAVELVRSGAVDGFAANRLRLLSMKEALPAASLLPGSLIGIPQAIATRADAPDLLHRLDAFIAQVHRSGFLADSIARAANGTEIEPL